MIDLKDLSIGKINKLFSWSNMNQGSDICELLSASFQGINRLFVPVYTITANVANNEEEKIE